MSNSNYVQNLSILRDTMVSNLLPIVVYEEIYFGERTTRVMTYIWV
jgi:hypothetical protein